MGEIVKHALCQDTQLLEMLDEFDGPLTDPDFLERVLSSAPGALRDGCEARFGRSETIRSFNSHSGELVSGLDQRHVCAFFLKTRDRFRDSARQKPRAVFRTPTWRLFKP